ncbi:MarR family winged helix-turn-helix transcriptional regulator [Belliella aquatica]|uniref:HTH-type transcriptional regulator SarZ n=1 Tax=Belliella aquatica TaxID=1323734 RepID=A0ABQ1MI68_9BACT|nr:MarR family transcriptional regulator [Belliella aquatica]MCH7405055.1 MarR family transcriptional regulator [Belliella aquatica]GGC40213.1 MarR family transcriptional regulator [Belliella aquatica]
MEQLKLENQICFPFYAISRLITRAYQPHLESLGITYPQFLVLLVLWEKDGQTVNQIADKLILNTNTITPLLKRMEQLELVSREKSKEDERKVMVNLTRKGQKMQVEAACIPDELLTKLAGKDIQREDLSEMKNQLNHWIALIK